VLALVDTSVWVDHFLGGDPGLSLLLEQNQVAIHDFVVGELACGNLKQRDTVLTLLQQLRRAVVAEHHEVLTFIERHQLMGLGVGYIDAHLLASVALTPDALLWTRDRRLGELAESLGLAYGRG
jgi:predicted nucleic acid-binding protein